MNRFPNGARVAFIGDSITAANLFDAHVAAYYCRTFPGTNISFFNFGVSGGSAGSAYLYLEKDVYPHLPTHAVIMLGVNDSGRGNLSLPRSADRWTRLKNSYDRYCENMRKLVSELQSKGIAVTLMTPAPYAEYCTTAEAPLPGGYALIAGYAEFIRNLAREKGCDLIDLHIGLTEALESADLYRQDHVHPNEEGHKVIAKLILAAQGLSADIADFAETEFPEHHDVVSKIRRLYAVEWMVIRNFDLPAEEKLSFIRAYLDEKRYPREYFESIARDYISYAPQWDSLISEMVRLTPQT